MAFTVTHANTVSTSEYGKKFMNNVYDSRPFTKLLLGDHKAKVKGGTQITFPVEHKQVGSAESRAWNTEVNYESVDTFTQAVLAWAHIDAQVTISNEERLKNQAGPQQIVDVVKAKDAHLKNDIAEQIADQVFATASATNKIIPLAVIIDSADTYAGITVSDAPAWAGIEDSTTTPMTRAFLYGRVAAATFDDAGPSTHFTTRTLLAEYNALLGGDERYHNTMKANAGFKTITLYGDNVYADSHVATGHWYGIDMDAVELRMMEGAEMKPTEWFDLKVRGFPGAMAKYVEAALNLVFYRRRTSFKCSALTGT